MKVEFNVKRKALTYTPETPKDAFDLGIAVTQAGWGSYTYNAEGIIKGVTFSTEGILEHLKSAEPRIHPNQP